MEIVDGSYESFAATRSGCLIGEGLVRRFGWSVGERIPLIGQIFPRADGSPWEFDIKGIYHSSSANVDDSTLFFDYEYLRQAIETGAVDAPEEAGQGVGVYVIALDSGASPTQVMADVDALFENGPQRVQTTTEAEFQRQFVTMYGSVPTLLSSIGGGVLFAILLAVVNTMLLAARERTSDLGVLKALGFTDGTAFALQLAESLILCTSGGLIAIGLAKLAEVPLRAVTGAIIPAFAIDSSIMLAGLAIAVGIGLVAGFVPAWRARRLRPVDALRAEL